MAPQTLARPNRYPAACIRCGAQVPAGEGLLVRDTDGRWAADHPADCPPKPTAIATPAAVKRVSQDGIYQRPDGEIYKVQIAKQGSRQLYAKHLTIRPCDLGPACKMCKGTGTREINGEQRPCLKGKFVYAGGEVHRLLADWRMPEDTARLFGRLYGVCVRCGADLTDEDSIAAGLGPICGGRW